MSCLYPLYLGIKDRNGNEIKVDCGRCLSCLIKKTQYLEFIANKELQETYKKGMGASFITLTYTDENIPLSVPKNRKLDKYEEIITDKKVRKDYCTVRLRDYLDDEIKMNWITQNGIITLKRRDLTKYIKRIRSAMKRNQDERELKIMYCGEYGGETQRSHYHLIIMGLSKAEAEYYSKGAWKEGLQDIGAVGRGGIRYLIDYINKSQDYKERNELYKNKGVEAPFIYHSINFGKNWIDSNAEELIKNGFTYYKNGMKRIIPTKVIKYICNSHGINEKTVYNKIFRNLEERTKNIRGNKTLEQYLFDEKAKQERQNYNEIRQQGEKSISPEYLNRLNEAETWERPRTTKLYTYDNVKNAEYKRIMKNLKISDRAEERRIEKRESELNKLAEETDIF